MDLNDIKNRAKDLLADITEPRQDRETRPGTGQADHPVDDPAARTDRLGPPVQHPAAERPDEPTEPTTAYSQAPTHLPPTREFADRPDATPRSEAPVERPVTEQPGERHLDPSAEPGRHQPRAGRPDELPADPERMVTAERAQSFGARWDEVKGQFVDEPRQAVARADALVGELLDELGELFAQQRRSIEQDLDTDDVSTEDLRVALRRYRSFFDRLLSV
jgi:hypothetical protein